MLPDDLAAGVEAERHRLGISNTEIIRRALESFLQGDPGRAHRLSFTAAGRSGTHTTARDAERILAREWVEPARIRRRDAPPRHR
jgi:hypothetical protein